MFGHKAFEALKHILALAVLQPEIVRVDYQIGEVLIGQ